jgi:hypothetical protein
MTLVSEQQKHTSSLPITEKSFCATPLRTFKIANGVYFFNANFRLGR